MSEDNKLKVGKRKNGFLVNEGDKVTMEERARRIAANTAKYGLSPEEVEAIVVPTVEAPKTAVAVDVVLHPQTVAEKKASLQKLQDRLAHLEAKLVLVRERNQANESRTDYDEDRDMVGCERCRTWCYMDEHGITKAPEGAWYCPPCVIARDEKRARAQDDDDEASNPKKSKN